MSKVFISHSSKDDGFVRELRESLAHRDEAALIDSRSSRGDPPWADIQKAIEDASVYAVVLSTDGLQSRWVAEELDYALTIQKQRGRESFPVIPLSLDGATAGVLEHLFEGEPIFYIPVSNATGGSYAALNAILTAIQPRGRTLVGARHAEKSRPLESVRGTHDTHPAELNNDISESSIDSRLSILPPEIPDDIFLVFVGHSADASLAAARVKQLESTLQRRLKLLNRAISGKPPFRLVEVWEWFVDMPASVEGQKRIDLMLDRADVAVFVFQDKVGEGTARELDRCLELMKPIPIIAVFAKNPSFTKDSSFRIETGDDVTRYATNFRSWQDLREYQRRLVHDWLQMKRRYPRPQKDFVTLEDLDQIILEQFDELLPELWRAANSNVTIDDAAQMRAVRTKDQLQLLYDKLGPLRRPCPNATSHILNWSLVENFAVARRKSVERSDDFLRRLGLFAEVSTSDRPELHKGAVLCFCDDPLRFIPEARAVFVLRERDQQSTTQVEGSLISQFQTLFALSKRYLSTADTIGLDGLRSKTTDIPEAVIREVIANAIVHRDYERGHINVAVTDDELVVSNPGEFPAKTSWMTFMSQEDSESIPRDETIAIYMTYLRGAEGVGQGFRLFRQHRRAFGDDSIHGDDSTPGIVKVRIKRRPVPVGSSLFVRRTVRSLEVPVVATPIRLLLVNARPEDDACGYIDHRASALPLVEAMEALGGLVRIHVLDPPTFPALREELDRARRARAPYHVVHFDGHGVYDRRAGLGGLCFEHPEDVGKLELRRHVTIYAKDLGPVLSEYRIPLVFLEADQTAKAEQASESVASELLKVGVASVVAMSHSVLVETSRRFVEAFYDALAEGARVGDAMLRGQRALKDDNFRGRVFAAGELRLEDWFVPVLFQEKDDPQLFRTVTSRQTQEDLKTALAARLGELPPEPETGFVGRSRELLALQRLLRGDGKARYAVIRGQGGEGKTALAAELARWMVRSRQIRRAAFVSVETHSNLGAVLDAIGRQLVPKYSVATFQNLEDAIRPIERALVEQSTLVVVDNVESILLPPYVETSDALSEEARRELDAILALCARLNANGDTRLVFTSREALPAPFDATANRRELHRLDREDAVKLVERALNEGDAGAGAAADAAREALEQLVDAVHGHARTLTLLAPSLRSRGVEATRRSLIELMAEMDRKFPASREKTLFASVELSLRRMSPENRDRARVLGVFHGAVDLDVLRAMMEWEEVDVDSLSVELIETGLATPDPYDHLTPNPALCPYLRGQMDVAERESLTARWVEAMRGYTGFLYQQQNQKAEVAATLTLLELPNLLALLDYVQREGDAEATIGLATSLYGLLQMLGKPRLLEQVAQARDAAAAALGQTWNHAPFEAQRTRIEQQLDAGRLREAFVGAQELLRRARQAGETTYPNADYDLAMACNLLGQVLTAAGRSEQALPFLNEALERFEAIAEKDADNAAKRMVSACYARRGDCLMDLGRLDEAAAAYVEGIRRAEDLGAERNIAVGKGQLGTVRLLQRRYEEALQAYEEARARFTRLDEPGSVAVIWHQTGRVYQEAGQSEAAEDAYRKSLALKVRLGNVAGQASTLGQLGNLYDGILGRPEEAVAFFRQAADKHAELGDEAGEGRTRSNLGETLRKLRRYEEARQEIRRAIECSVQFGHASEPWTTWSILHEIETAEGNPVAAAEAKRKAVECYLAYRRDGGENHNPDGRICLAVTQAQLAGEPAAASSLLQQVSVDSELPRWLRPVVQALQDIVGGSRDRTLADHPELNYSSAAEILILLETLEQADATRA